MKRELFKTGDGSFTIRIPEWDEQYHSKHGAIREAEHVFISSGLDFYQQKFTPTADIRVLEIGLGTGLNALLTSLYALEHNLPISYTALEAFPVEEEEWKHLNFAELISKDSAISLYHEIHQSPWEQWESITETFKLLKNKIKFQDFKAENAFDLIYFDAFGARVQPELWEQDIFQNMYDALAVDGVLVTYSSKGSVRRAMKAVGFEVEKIPGPPGKREMLRALKMKDLK